ncbi:MAG: hypothetical protein ACXAEN_25880 [Candidatus Thorarchaeota archaeon]|jgi:hypothetical protein
MLRLKGGVKLRQLQPALAMVITGTCVPLFREYNVDCVVTSCNDSNHSSTSLHFSGCAVDLRSKHLANDHDKKVVQATLSEYLGRDFDVLLEHLGSANEHFHLEWQPRG